MRRVRKDRGQQVSPSPPAQRRKQAAKAGAQLASIIKELPQAMRTRANACLATLVAQATNPIVD
eukprot:5302374-Alexandrium_andersonii.AAC.1